MNVPNLSNIHEAAHPVGLISVSFNMVILPDETRSNLVQDQIKSNRYKVVLQELFALKETQ